MDKIEYEINDRIKIVQFFSKFYEHIYIIDSESDRELAEVDLCNEVGLSDFIEKIRGQYELCK